MLETFLPAPARWRSLGFALMLAATAMIVGLAIAYERWPYLGILAFIPLLWFWPVQTSMGLFAMMVPFEGITNFGDTTLILLVGLLAGGTLIAVGLINHRFCRPPQTVLWWSLFLFWGLVSALWAADPSTTLERLPTAAALVGFYIAAVSFRITEEEFRWIVRLAIVGGCFTAAFLAYEYFTGVSWITMSQTGSVLERGTLIMGEKEVNPDSVGLKFIIPISLAVATYLSSRRTLIKGVAIIALGANVGALLLTMSRAAFLSLIVLIVVFARRLRLDRRLIVVGVVAGALLASMPTSFFQRLAEKSAQSGSGRLYIWRVGLEMVKHNPILGIGFGNFLVVYKDYAGYAQHFMGYRLAPHNLYLEIWTELGILGVLLFFMAIRAQVKVISGAAKNHAISVWLVASEAAFWAILVYGFFMGLLWDKTFWLSGIFLAFAVMLQKETNQPAALDPAYSDARNAEQFHRVPQPV